jgi:hypothetical protein
MEEILRRNELLNNGARVVCAKKRDNHQIVLAVWKKDHREEFVTWAVDRDRNCYWGHYHFNLFDAMKDYWAR